VFPAGLDLSSRIETEQYNHQNEDDWCYAHGFFDYRQKIAALSKPRRTPSNGLETANQKQKSQAGSLAVGFVFMLIAQATQHRHFRKGEVFLRSALAEMELAILCYLVSPFFCRTRRVRLPHRKERLSLCQRHVRHYCSDSTRGAAMDRRDPPLSRSRIGTLVALAVVALRPEKDDDPE
jgi:hypothetical protein